MARLNLVIGDNDEIYLDSLACFLIRNYSHRFVINSFSKKDCLEKYLMESSDKIDILLLGIDIDTSLISKDTVNCLIILAESNGKTGPNTINAIDKYQQGDKLVGCIMNLFSETNRVGSLSAGAGKKAQVVSVFSPQGGSGKTCTALSSSIQCARKGMKVFYLNLEDFNSTSSFFTCNNNSSLSDIIYYLKEKNKNLSMKIEALKSVDTIWGIHYFSPPESDTELNEISFSDLRELLEQMILLGTYDFIFLDMSSNLGERTMELLKFSDSIVLTLDGGLCGGVKLGRFLNDVRLFMQQDTKDVKNKINLVLNRYRKGMEFNFKAYTGEVDFINLPEINDFDWSKLLHMVKMDRSFVEAIDQLIHNCTAVH